ncbi:FAD-dependent oxidoreductase [Pseudonocardiaceae bacterium YIM PH 21723]|nr:FAD-dependent oxidoreductase [Pseudonocardiaceae bacterium YIM PH 21723]
MSTRVLICGASIAGPILAHCLALHDGFEVTVVERASGLRPGGQAVDLRGPGKELIKRLGLDERIRAACTEVLGMSAVDRDGNELNRHLATDLGGDGPIAEIEILRGDLSELLYEETAGQAEYRFGDHVVELEQRADRVEVRFASGLRETYDLVVGADGLRSGTRAMVFGPHEDYVRDLGALIAYFDVPNHLELDRWMLYHGKRGHAAAIRSIRDNREATALIAVPGVSADYDHRDVAGQKALIRERTAGMGWEVPWLLDRMDEAEVFYFDTCGQAHLPSWSAGRVVLLGDAACCAAPTSGQGTNQAFIGAYILAGELAKAGDDHSAAFSAYERLMRDYVAGNQRMGALTAVPFAEPEEAAEWNDDRTLGTVHGIELPDYAVL